MIKGSHISEEVRLKMRLAKIGSKNPNYQKHNKHSLKTKKKISEANKGRKLSIETKLKMSLAKKGINNPNYGINRSEETNKKIISSFKKQYKKINHPLFGKHHTEETKQKMREKRKNQIITDETRKKISNAFKGCTPWNKGKKGLVIWTKEAKLKMSLACKGEKSPNWKGGLSFLPYSVDWSKTLRRSIRERDNYVCQLCSKIQTEQSFDVHHIDYNKKNCNPDNLITLCRSCHIKTNAYRDNWKYLFTELIKAKSINL